MCADRPFQNYHSHPSGYYYADGYILCCHSTPSDLNSLSCYTTASNIHCLRSDTISRNLNRLRSNAITGDLNTVHVR